MKTVVIAVACFILAFPGWSRSKNGERVSKENNAGHAQPANKSGASQQNSTDPAPIKDVQPVPSEDQQNAQYFDYSKHQPEKNGDSDSGLVTVTVWLAIAGFVQAVVLAVQARLLFQQKKIMEEHKASLEQLATAGRAWLLIRKTGTQDAIQDPALITPEEMMVRRQFSHCIFWLKNYGKTPARMIAWKYELQIGENAYTVPDPSVYDMSILPKFTPDMIPQSASVAQQATFRIAPGPNDFSDAAKGTKFLWLCGTVWYEDTFQRGEASKHETVFCYLWETRMSTPKFFWTVAGLREHNNAT